MKDYSKEFNFTILIIVLILITLVAGGGLALKKQFDPKPDEAVHIESALTRRAKEISGKIYKYRNSQYKDFDKLSNIVKNLDFIGFRFVSCEYSENNENILTVSYKADSRSKFRIMSDYNKNFYQTSISLFALVKDLSGVRISVSDDYGEFCSFFAQRDLLYENFDTRAYTKTFLSNAANAEESFIDFIEGLLLLNVPVEGKAFERKIYKALPADLELVEGSATDISATISRADAKLLAELGADTADCVNRPCEIKIYSVNNYIKNEISPYVFVFADGELLTFAKLEDEKMKTEIISNLN